MRSPAVREFASGKSGGGGRNAGSFAGAALREFTLFSGILFVIAGPVAGVAFGYRTFAEKRENDADPPIGTRVTLDDGRRLHVKDSGAVSVVCVWMRIGACPPCHGRGVWLKVHVRVGALTCIRGPSLWCSRAVMKRPCTLGSL